LTASEKAVYLTWPSSWSCLYCR